MIVRVLRISSSMCCSLRATKNAAMFSNIVFSNPECATLSRKCVVDFTLVLTYSCHAAMKMSSLATLLLLARHFKVSIALQFNKILEDSILNNS